MTLKCPEIQSQRIFFKIFLVRHAPRRNSISMLCMLTVLCTKLAFMTTHHSKLFSIHIALLLVGLTTKKLLPTACYLMKNVTAVHVTIMIGTCEGRIDPICHLVLL